MAVPRSPIAPESSVILVVLIPFIWARKVSKLPSVLSLAITAREPVIRFESVSRVFPTTAILAEDASRLSIAVARLSIA
jgi:hypothetical protein